MAGEVVEGPAEQTGGGVAAGEEDVEELAAEFDGVAGRFDEFGEEDVFVAALRGWISRGRWLGLG